MNAEKIYELPINLGKFCDFRYVFSGGGYFRMIPYHLLQSMYKKINIRCLIFILTITILKSSYLVPVEILPDGEERVV